MTATRTPWRDVLKVHPAAELFPLMSADELRELADDIDKHGLIEFVRTYYDEDSGIEWLVDGRNRLDALTLLGRDVVVIADDDDGTPVFNDDYAGDLSPLRHKWTDAELVAYVISKNIRRRHLTNEQRRAIIAELIKLTPEKSNRLLATEIGVDHKTIGSIRKEAEELGKLPQLDKTIGKDGKARPAKMPSTAVVTYRDYCEGKLPSFADIHDPREEKNARARARANAKRAETLASMRGALDLGTLEDFVSQCRRSTNSGVMEEVEKLYEAIALGLSNIAELIETVGLDGCDDKTYDKILERARQVVAAIMGSRVRHGRSRIHATVTKDVE